MSLPFPSPLVLPLVASGLRVSGVAANHAKKRKWEELRGGRAGERAFFVQQTTTCTYKWGAHVKHGDWMDCCERGHSGAGKFKPSTGMRVYA